MITSLGSPPEVDPWDQPILTGPRCLATSTPASAFWQERPRPAGTPEVRCAHCQCWFDFHADRAINACWGGCSGGCPGFEPADTNELPKRKETAA